MIAARVYVRTEAFVELLSAEERLWVAQHHEEVVNLFAATVRHAAMKRLEFVQTVSFPEVPEFVSEDKFREGETVDGVKIKSVGKNFKANFLKKVEKNIPALDLREHRVLVKSRDAEVIAKLGGEQQVTTYLAHLWESLKSADHRQWLLRYICDEQGALWRISGYWREGLDVEASPLDIPVDHPAHLYDIRLISP
jgi:hypothetical protein